MKNSFDTPVRVSDVETLQFQGIRHQTLMGNGTDFLNVSTYSIMCMKISLIQCKYVYFSHLDYA